MAKWGTPLELAQQWHAAHTARHALIAERDALNVRLNSFAEEAAEREKDLRALLDNSTPQRLFQVEAGVVVMVSATRGVELVALEPLPGPPKETGHGRTD